MFLIFSSVCQNIFKSLKLNIPRTFESIATEHIICADKLVLAKIFIIGNCLLRSYNAF